MRARATPCNRWPDDAVRFCDSVLRVNRETSMRPEPGVKSIAIEAAAAPTRAKPSNYPEPFFSRMSGREKRPLGDLFGLKNFGVNLTTLHPGGESALLHRWTRSTTSCGRTPGTPGWSSPPCRRRSPGGCGWTCRGPSNRSMACRCITCRRRPSGQSATCPDRRIDGGGGATRP